MASRYCVAVEAGPLFDPDVVAGRLRNGEKIFANYLPGMWMLVDDADMSAGWWRDWFVGAGAKRVIVVGVPDDGGWAVHGPRQLGDWMHEQW